MHKFKHKIVFSKFLELFMNMFVQWCQLPHLPMVNVIVVYRHKATNAASKLLYDIFIYFLHIFTIITVFNNFIKENT